MPRKKIKSAPVAPPSKFQYDPEIHIANRGSFAVGESVWVKGWSRSKRATYLLKKIVTNTETGERWVDIWEQTPSAARMRSVDVDRLGKRRS